MLSLLIAVIYLAFISMGLPDALLGSAWPAIFEQMAVPVSYAGLVTILIASGTVISSLLSTRLVRRFGTATVTIGCTLLTAIALLGFSISNAFWQLCLWALPYGLGAGSIDAALNNYVAVKYRSREMSWIHFCWGLGATIGPYVMGAVLTQGAVWTSGYRVVGIVQMGMTLFLVASLPLWKRNGLVGGAEDPSNKGVSTAKAFGLPGAKTVLLAFFCYCALESTTGLWASSYMVLHRGIATADAARWTSFFYLGITVGRFFNGFITDRVGDRRMVRVGQILIVLGTLTLLLPPNVCCYAGLTLIGLGCAPVFPCLLHETPSNFGTENSQAIMGLQMACAYTGSTLMPPLFGLLAQRFGVSLYPFYLFAFAALMLISSERLHARFAKRAAEPVRESE